MAATDDTSRGAGRAFDLITLAALALPGVMPGAAHAEEAPERGSVAIKYLYYKDSQSVNTSYPYYDGSEPSKLDRITVSSPALQLVVPLGRRWSVEAGAVVDQVSGASPKYYTDVSGASQMSDRRAAGDVKIVRYFERGAIGVGAAYSTENDYRSSSLSLDGRWSTADNNTTLSIGLGGASDSINPVKGGQHDVSNERKRSAELMLGLTQVLSADDLVQVTLTGSRGRGYYSDPYKLFDARPRERNAAIGVLRWNHHFAGWGASLRSSYRYYRDSFGIKAHTFDAAWVQPLSDAVKLTPSVRYYSQSAASFYYDPVTDINVYPAPLGNPTYSSADQRLSAFGCITAGMKLEWQLGDWATDLKVERYEQRSAWRMGGSGSTALDPFQAIFVQMGVSRAF
ncbi:MAG: DUF3570 domain-containing protein [Burkholderiales bacterium]